MEIRLNSETQQNMVSNLQEDHSKLNRQLTQLQLALQERDSHITCVHTTCFVTSLFLSVHF